MKFAPSPQQTTQQARRANVGASAAKSHAGSKGVALSPPAYGVAFADDQAAPAIAPQPSGNKTVPMAGAQTPDRLPPPVAERQPLRGEARRTPATPSSLTPSPLPPSPLHRPAKVEGDAQKQTGSEKAAGPTRRAAVAAPSVAPASFAKPAAAKPLPTGSPVGSATLPTSSSPTASPPSPATPSAEPIATPLGTNAVGKAPVSISAAVTERPTAAPAVTTTTVAVAEGTSAPIQPETSAAAGAGKTGEAVKLLMPEPPADLTDEHRGRLAHVQQRVNQTATIQSSVPSAEASTATARNAVTEPAAELQARAQHELVAALDEQPTPSPQILELCQQIRLVIAAKRPPDEKSFLTADFETVAKSAGSALNQSIDSQAGQVEGQYASLNEEQAAGSAVPGQAITPPPSEVAAPEMQATAAAPAPIPAENLSLQPDVAASQARINAAGMNTAVAQTIQSGPVAEARTAQADLQENAAEAEAAMITRQDEAIANAQSNMGNLQAQALQMLTASRKQNLQGSGQQQKSMVSQEEALRQQISSKGKQIFSKVQQQVMTLLKPLREHALARWNAGIAKLSQAFKGRLAAVDQWKKERYEGFVGSLLEFAESLVGMPPWVTIQLNQAEKEFGDGVCQLLTEISTEVNSIIATCQQLIANARQQHDQLFQDNLPQSLQSWAQEQRASFQARLDGLQNQVSAARDGINQGLVKEAAQAVQAVRQEIHKRREESQGVLQKIGDAIATFMKDPVRAMINGLLYLVNIPSEAFWSLADRIRHVMSEMANDTLGFADKLLSAIGKGFSQFFDNFGTHVLAGFWEWLFSGLGSLGIELPRQFSLKAIFTFILQLLGVSWAKIRALLAKRIGEKNIALIEKAWGLVANLIEKGAEGLFELIKHLIDPKTFVNQILNAAVDFMVIELIKQATLRVALLFNPVGAIVQAVMAIYKVLKWIFTNAARIFSLVETVVNGMAALIAGDIGGMATSVEKALVRLIAPVISFIADLVGLDDLPDKIAKTIQGFKGWIEGIVERVIEWLVERGKKLLAAAEPSEMQHQELKGNYDGQIGKSISWSAEEGTHRLWIGVSGQEATVLMSSETKPITQWFTEYQNRIEQIKEPDKQRILLKLLKEARQMIGELDQQADGLAIELSKPNSNLLAVESIDAKAEAKEEQLASVIKHLHEELGFTPMPNHLPDVTIQKNLLLSNENHTVTAKSANGKLELSMSSRRMILSLGLTSAQSEIKNNSDTRDHPDTPKVLTLLSNAQALVDSSKISEDWNLSKGKMSWPQYLDLRLNQIIAEIVPLGNFGITSIDTMFRQLLRNNGPYKYLVDPPDIAPFRVFSNTQRTIILHENRSQNSGQIRSDESEEILDDSLGIEEDKKPNIDHIFPRSQGGSNSYSNAQVLSRKENMAKGID